MTAIPDLDGFVEHNGVRVSYVDGDGDPICALGHHDDAEAVISAFVRHSVQDCRLAGICDDAAWAVPADRPDLLRRTWAGLEPGNNFETAVEAAKAWTAYMEAAW